MISEIENSRRREANYRPLTPIHFLLRSADVFPDRVAVIDGARSFTWRQYADRCLRLASALRKRGIGKERHRSQRVKNPPRAAPKRDQRRHGGAFAGNILACVRRCASSERTIRYRIARGPGF